MDSHDHWFVATQLCTTYIRSYKAVINMCICAWVHYGAWEAFMALPWYNYNTTPVLM